MTAANDHLHPLPTQPSPEQEVPDEFDLLCEHCGYSLVGLTTSNRCPECGQEFDPLDLPLARVPWLFRRRLGKLASYRQTVWAILRHPNDFAKELCRPVRVSISDARAFRRFTIRMAVMTCIAGGLIVAALAIPWSVLWAPPPGVRIGVRPSEIIAGVLIAPAAIALIYLLLVLVTDLPTFIWEGLKGDPLTLAPVHHYASAPLALLPLLLVPFTIMVLLLNFREWDLESLFTICASVTLGLGAAWILLLLWIIPLRFMRAATGCSWRRVIALAIYLPFHWLLMAIMCLMALSAICWLIMSTVDSLR